MESGSRHGGARSVGLSSLRGKVALIPGSGTGIGQGIAKHLSMLGCKVVMTGRNMDRLKQAKEICKNAGAKDDHLLLVKADVVKEETVKDIIQSAIEKFGKIDILVNNAGVAVFDDIENTSLEHFDTTFNVNVRGPFHLTMLAVPHLIKAKGVIINVSHCAGSRPLRELLTYGMSKAALDHFTRTLAVELGPKGVRVNTVSLGEIRTSVAVAMGMSQQEYDKFVESAVQFHPMGRCGTVEDVARAVAFLACEDSGFITGASLPVDGGWQCVHPYVSWV